MHVTGCVRSGFTTWDTPPSSAPRWNGCVAHRAAFHGLVVAQGDFGVDIVNCRATENGYAGFKTEAALTGSRLSGCHASGNGTASRAPSFDVYRTGHELDRCVATAAPSATNIGYNDALRAPVDGIGGTGLRMVGCVADIPGSSGQFIDESLDASVEPAPG